MVLRHKLRSNILSPRQEAPNGRDHHSHPPADHPRDRRRQGRGDAQDERHEALHGRQEGRRHARRQRRRRRSHHGRSQDEDPRPHDRREGVGRGQERAADPDRPRDGHRREGRLRPGRRGAHRPRRGRRHVRGSAHAPTAARPRPSRSCASSSAAARAPSRASRGTPRRPARASSASSSSAAPASRRSSGASTPSSRASPSPSRRTSSSSRRGSRTPTRPPAPARRRPRPPCRSASPRSSKHQLPPQIAALQFLPQPTPRLLPGAASVFNGLTCAPRHGVMARWPSSTRLDARRARTRSPRSAGRPARTPARRARGRRGRRPRGRAPRRAHRRARASVTVAPAARAASAPPRAPGDQARAVRSRPLRQRAHHAGDRRRARRRRDQRARQQRRRQGRALRGRLHDAAGVPAPRLVGDPLGPRAADAGPRPSRRPRHRSAPPANPRGVGRGSLLRPFAFGAAIKRLRNGGYGRLTNLRVAPERIDAILLTKGGALRNVQIVPGGAVRQFGTATGGFRGVPTMSLAGINSGAPQRLTRSAAERLGVPASRVNYLVYTQFGGVAQWNVYFTGGQIFSADAQRADHAARQLTGPPGRGQAFSRLDGCRPKTRSAPHSPASSTLSCAARSSSSGWSARSRSPTRATSP